MSVNLIVREWASFVVACMPVSETVRSFSFLSFCNEDGLVISALCTILVYVMKMNSPPVACVSDKPTLLPAQSIVSTFCENCLASMLNHLANIRKYN